MDNQKSLEWILRGAYFLLIGLFISKLFNFLFRLVVAKSLGPSNYGTFSIGLAIFSVFVLFGTLGFEQGIERFFNIKKINTSEKRDLLFFSLKIILLFSLFLAVILFLFSREIVSYFTDSGELYFFVRILAFFLPVMILNEILVYSFRGIKKIEWFVLIKQIIEPITKLGLVVVFLFLGYNLFGVFMAYGMAIFLSFLVSIFLIFKIFPVKSEKNKELRWKLFQFSWPLFLFNAIYTLMGWIDTFMIGFYIGDYSVGLYNVALPLAGLLIIPSNLFRGLFVPVITELYSLKKYKEIVSNYLTLLRWFFILTFPLFIFMFVFSSELILVFFGVDYLNSVNALRVLLIGFMVCSLFGILGLLYNSLALSKLKFKIGIVAIFLSLILNIFFIQIYGLVGAAIATSISLFIFNIILYVPLRKKIQLCLLDFYLLISYFKVILFSGLSFFCIYNLFDFFNFSFKNLFVLIGFGLSYFMIYFVFIFLSKGITKRDLNLIFKKRI